jgi:hypothetical protein
VLPPAVLPPADRVDPAMEFTREVLLSGNLMVGRQRFWLGADRAGHTVTFWADSPVVHLLVNGVRLKTVPSRLTPPTCTGCWTTAAAPPDHHHHCGPTTRVRPSKWIAPSTPPALSARPDGNTPLATTSPDARPAGTLPQPQTRPLRVERRISSRGFLTIAGQRVQIGMVHAGRTVTVETADTTWRIYHDDELVTEVHPRHH